MTQYENIDLGQHGSVNVLVPDSTKLFITWINVD